ncbi:MAG: cell division protein FtsW [Candidatus Nomurabacteria bacterium]|nr:MAG: cell division protein FtsW [Candidatus Nomurabacteria bacterium]HRV76296.1 putative peptidoglycan glycosyltransferase FtsW [Candidatus Saccharimonadales bacterium]
MQLNNQQSRRGIKFDSSRAERRGVDTRALNLIGNNSDLSKMLSFGWAVKLFKKLTVKFSFEGKRRKRADYSILVIVMLMIALGTLTLYAIGPAVLKRTGGGLGRQTLFLLVGLIGMLIAYKIPKLDFLIKYAPYILGLGILLCLMILIPGIGKVVYGGRRWIEVGPFNMQPSELVKAGVVFFLSGVAVYFKSSESKDANTQVMYLAVISGIIGLFILILQRDLGTTLVIATIMLFILVAGGVSRKVITKLAVVALVGLILSIMMFGYRRARLLSFLGSNNSLKDSAEVESPADYHLRQSLIAIGSGGIYGRGVGKSVQSFGYLPEAPSDSIFAVYAEKFGLLGSIVILALFGTLIKKMLEVMQGLDLYWRTVMAGITGWVVGNFAVNMGSILGLIPFTGVPLPFFSLGGTNLVIMMTMMGIVLNLSTYKRNKIIGFGEDTRL